VSPFLLLCSAFFPPPSESAQGSFTYFGGVTTSPFSFDPGIFRDRSDVEYPVFSFLYSAALFLFYQGNDRHQVFLG